MILGTIEALKTSEYSKTIDACWKQSWEPQLKTSNLVVNKQKECINMYKFLEWTSSKNRLYCKLDKLIKFEIICSTEHMYQLKSCLKIEPERFDEARFQLTH